MPRERVGETRLYVAACFQGFIFSAVRFGGTLQPCHTCAHLNLHD